MADPEIFEEWRVTGDPGYGFPPYEFVWSKRINPHLGDDPERGAREFTRRQLEAAAQHGHWRDGPHLSHRTVTITPWEETE